MLETGTRSRHCERIAVVRSHLIDLAAEYDVHDLFGGADSSTRKSAAERFRQCHHVRSDAELLGCATRRDAEARFDFVENENDAVSLGDVADGFEVTRLGENDAEIHHGRF